MITETVRMLAAWWGHATYGVNALRTSVPLASGDTVPPALQLLTSVGDGRVARGDIPSLESGDLPALLVTTAEQPIETVAPVVRPFPPDATVSVMARIAMSTQDTAKAERDTSALLRALWRSTGLLWTTAAGESLRQREQVQLIAPAWMTLATLYESNTDTIVTGGLLLAVRVRDLHAATGV